MDREEVKEIVEGALAPVKQQIESVKDKVEQKAEHRDEMVEIMKTRLRRTEKWEREFRKWKVKHLNGHAPSMMQIVTIVGVMATICSSIVAAAFFLGGKFG